jgi:hypothetical protein|tara:strand:- start:433 stop:681 length:249 start_codon:yes stop_codon:yes gene_type:complete
MDEWRKLIRTMVTDVLDGPGLPEDVAEDLAESLGIAPDQVEELAAEIKTILADERELEAMARADSVDEVIESISSLLVELKR